MDRIKRLMLIFIAVLNGCIDPVPPEFQYEEGLLFVEGFIATEPGASFVTLNESSFEFGFYDVIPITGAEVSFENLGTGQIISLAEEEGVYVPPSNFKAAVGEIWELDVTLANGSQYRSSSENIQEPVPIANLKASYNAQLRFNDGSNKFEPGHAISVTLNDPANKDNWYYWTFRSFENITLCEICFDGILRNGECITTTVRPRPDYFTYNCETECWKVRFPDKVTIFDDEFSDGKTIKDLKIADIPLYSKREILVQIQQFSLTPAAYDYYKVLKDVVENNAGLNAPPPAALVGNMVNVNDSDEFIFGRFTAAATTTASIFINRDSILEGPLEPRIMEVQEPVLNSPYPPPPTIRTPCEESRYRTAIRPKGWVD